MSEMEKPNETAKPNAEPNANVESKERKANERAKFIKEVMSLEKNLDYAKSVRANFYFVVVKLMMHSFEQTARIGKTERKLIRLLRERGLSIGEIAWIMNRSKSTIHDNLNEVGESIEPNEGELT
jgi:DNA-binding NarL/FixJ family response regulator